MDLMSFHDRRWDQIRSKGTAITRLLSHLSAILIPTQAEK